MPVTATSNNIEHDNVVNDAANTASSSMSTTSRTTLTPSLRPTSPYLDLPSHTHRRSSLSSTFSGSDISELSFTTDPLHTFPLLTSSPPSSKVLSSTHQALHQFWITNYGALLVLFAQFFGCLMNLTTTMLEHGPPGSTSQGMHPFQILFIRQSITSLVCIVWAMYTRAIPHFPFGPPDLRIRLLLFTRGFTGFLGVFGMYFSLLYLPLAEATVLTFLAPILTCYLCSWIIPGDGAFGRQQQIAGFVSLIGVVFIARPASLFASSSSGPPSTVVYSPSNTTIANGTIPASPSSSTNKHTSPTVSQHTLAIAISLLGVLGATGAMTSIRMIGNGAHPFLSINYFSVTCAVVSLLALMVSPGVKFRLPRDGVEWGCIFVLGSCGFVFQWLLTRGLSYGGGGERSDDKAEVELEEGGMQVQQSGKKEVRVKGSGTRATSMVYTQMLFALAGDKVVFGVSPGLWSWVGSGLILAGAVWVAAARESGEGKVDEDGSIEMRGSAEMSASWKLRGEVAEEEQVGLMSVAVEDD
jgi:drug/metabolite transporter (DMT)-like permease